MNLIPVRGRRVSCLGVIVLLFLNSAIAAPPTCTIRFRDVTGDTGITFTHTDGGSGRRNIMETVSAGLALFDYDNDGDIDVYLLNGAPFEGPKPADPPRNALYRNDGDFHFVDVTEESGLGDTGHGLGVAVGDYDNDGDGDVYLNNYGTNAMYRNNGDGTFTNATEETGTGGGAKIVGAGTCFLDADADGDLDLYVANYLDFAHKSHVHKIWMGFHVYAGPEHYTSAADNLYRNNGDGTFTDISVESGITADAGAGMGMVCADYDNDGDTDIFVANDAYANFLLENDGSGKFFDTGLLSGVAYDLYGSRQGSMGVDCGDYDNDGLLDFYQTSYQDQSAILYRNLGEASFEDVTTGTGAGRGTHKHVTWGIGVVDFDNDGDRDLFVACGHLQDNVDLFSDVTSYRAKNILLMNDGKGKFVDVSPQVGDGLLPKFSSRGAAFDDLDNDGDIDAVILNSREGPTVIRNESVNTNHWLGIRLEGARSNRDGIGAHVAVTAGDLTQMGEVHSGRSYQSHFGRQLHFGLGSRNHVDRVEIRWIGGGKTVLEDVQADQSIAVVETDTPDN